MVSWRINSTKLSNNKKLDKMKKSKSTNLLSHALYTLLCVVRLFLMCLTVGLIALIVSPIFYLLGVKKPFESFLPVFERLSFNMGHDEDD